MNRAAVKEMHRQVGDLTFDREGLAIKGLLVRHLVMPGQIDETRAILQFLANEISPHTFVNIMGQYHPAGQVSRKKYSEINRGLKYQELQEAFRIGREAGLHRFDA